MLCFFIVFQVEEFMHFRRYSDRWQANNEHCDIALSPSHLFNYAGNHGHYLFKRLYDFQFRASRKEVATKKYLSVLDLFSQGDPSF